MRRRTLGNTGIELPELVLGTWGLSGDGYGQVDEADQDQVIARALGLGIDAFDTSDAYAKGKMEERLGRLLADREGAVVITKIGTDRAASPPIKRFDAEYLREAANKSKERLGRRIDVLLLHNPSTVALDKPHVAETMKSLCEDGIARAWGVSMGDAAVGTRAVEQGAQVLELAFNAFHQQDLSGVLTLAREKQVGLIGRSALSHGLLCGQWPSTKQFPQGDHRRDRWTLDDFKKRISQLSALRPSVGGDIPSLRAAALRFALSEPALSAVVIGPRSAVQLDQLLREAGKEPPYLPEDSRNALIRRLENVGIHS
ncbi:MAG: Aldo-keto reductase [Polyangiaceae bacterium]|nr:Aldo-keto reductase [Polyangiaceae bacterium]